MEYEVVVGIEIHVQLDTKTKMFCDCLISHGKHDEPNSHTCPICLGFPGALPVLNEGAVERGVMLAKALDCNINEVSYWDRKQYFYPDLAKGFQISQYEKPFAEGGQLEFFYEKDHKNKVFEKFKITLERIHLEEDTGQSFHADGNSYIDFNRCGTPLVEIVTNPDIVADPKEAGNIAKAFLEELQFVLQNESIMGQRDLGSESGMVISRGKLEEGNMRFDVNISVRKKGEEKFGTKQEVKNLNSLSAVKNAIDIQSKKQIEKIESGEKVNQSTWTYSDKKQDTVMLRSKEDAHDYRYFREPDLPELRIENSEIRIMNLNRKGIELMQKYPGLSIYFVREYLKRPLLDIDKFVGSGLDYSMFEEFFFNHNSKEYVDYEQINNEAEIYQEGLEFIAMYRQEGKVSASSKGGFDEIVRRMFEEKKHPREFISEYEISSDEGDLSEWIDSVIEENPDQVKEYKAGKEALMGFFVGQVMQKSQGKADAKKVKDLLILKLKE